MKSAAAGPETRAIAAAGGSRRASRSGASTAATRPGSAWSAASSTGWSGCRVCTSRRPCPSPAAHHPAGPREQRQRLLGRPVAGRGQLLVEVEEGDRVGRGDPVQDGLGADHHPGAGIARARTRR